MRQHVVHPRDERELGYGRNLWLERLGRGLCGTGLPTRNCSAFAVAVHHFGKAGDQPAAGCALGQLPQKSHAKPPLYMPFRTSTRVAAVPVLLLSLLGGGCSEEEKCASGDEGCECYPNETCNGNLACYSNFCVDPDKEPGGSGGGDGSSEAESGETNGESSRGGGQSESDGTNDDSAGSRSGPDGTGDATGPTPSNSTSQSETSGSTDTDEPTGPVVPGDPPVDSPVHRYGQLRVSGTQLVSESGDPVQLKGVSSMWLNWEEDGFAEDRDGLRYMRDTWNLSLIRAAMGVEAADDSPTYLVNPEHARAQVEKIVANAIELGVYVIIDWHDHEAIAHRTQAQEFFAEMAEKYKNVPNVLYEVFNEPLDLSWTGELKPYHEALRDTIRAHDPDNVIILGTPNWDQDVDVAAQSPLSGDNLMYTLHFYSCSHATYPFRDRAQSALDAGLPLFVSEWGAATADGIETDSGCIAEAAAWHDWMDDNHISWAAWKFDNCADATCFFVDDAVPTNGNWSAEQINGLHPEFAIERMKNAAEPGPDPDPTACTASGSCASGDAVDCDAEGQPVEANCDPCALLSCGTACCDRVGVFGAYVTAVQYDYVEQPSLVADYTATDAVVSLSAEFDESLPNWFQQFAAHTFRFTQSRAPADVADVVVCVDTNERDMMSLTFENGDDGCAVALMEVDVGCYQPEYLESCWGAWESIDNWTQLNVRSMATQYSTNFSTTLDVTSVLVP